MQEGRSEIIKYGKSNTQKREHKSFLTARKCDRRGGPGLRMAREKAGRQQGKESIHEVRESHSSHIVFTGARRHLPG